MHTDPLPTQIFPTSSHLHNRNQTHSQCSWRWEVRSLQQMFTSRWEDKPVDKLLGSWMSYHTPQLGWWSTGINWPIITSKLQCYYGTGEDSGWGGTISECVTILQHWDYFRAKKICKSRWQQKREKFQHSDVSPSIPPEPDVWLDFNISGNIIQLQHQDKHLAEYFQKTRESKGETIAGFILYDGILHKQHGS